MKGPLFSPCTACAFRYKLRTLSDRELIQFGLELRKKCLKPKEDCCWKELQLARETTSRAAAADSG